jgi:tellurite resistance protein
MFASFRNSLAGDGIDGRVSSVARQIAADHADSKVTLELAAAAILSDGPAAPAERAALEQLAEELGADPDAALAMLD